MLGHRVMLFIYSLRQATTKNWNIHKLPDKYICHYMFIMYLWCLGIFLNMFFFHFSALLMHLRLPLIKLLNAADVQCVKVNKRLLLFKILIDHRKNLHDMRKNHKQPWMQINDERLESLQCITAGWHVGSFTCLYP